MAELKSSMDMYLFLNIDSNQVKDKGLQVILERILKNL